MPKCSSEIHKDNDAILFCYECKIYMCNKCENLHSQLFKNHHQYKFEKDANELFTGLCNENNHPHELKYFCKNHNKLCCAECITKFKGNDHGQHSDCTVCSIIDIENEKKNKLNENVICLEELSLNFKQSIKEIKIMLEDIEKSKEEIKINIQSIFTKLRNAINEREDELLLNVDKKFEENFLSENFIKEIDKLPQKVQTSLEKGKLMEKNWKNNNLNLSINDCLNIESNINEINQINLKIKEFKKIPNNIQFIHTKDTNQIFERIKNFGKIYQNPFSEIIKKEEFDKINEWIGSNNNFILKYSALKDGCDPNVFHEKCDDINGCIIICQVEEGDIIGGYISTKIQKKDEFSDDNKAFLFNLTQNIIKKNKKSYKNAIKNFNDTSNFIRFENSCNVFILSGNCINDNESYITTCSCEANFDCDSLNLFNKNNDMNFKVKNFEIFELY